MSSSFFPFTVLREAAKSSFISGPATKRGGGKAGPLRKNNFFEARKIKSEKIVANKLEGGRVPKKRAFCGFPYLLFERKNVRNLNVCFVMPSKEF